MPQGPMAGVNGGAPVDPAMVLNVLIVTNVPAISSSDEERV